MSEEPSRKKSRSSRWGGDDDRPVAPPHTRVPPTLLPSTIAPPPGMGIPTPPSVGASGLSAMSGVPPPPPPPGVNPVPTTTTVHVPPPPPPPGSTGGLTGAGVASSTGGDRGGPVEATGGGGTAGMSVEAAKAAAARAAAAIQAQLGVNLGVSVAGGAGAPAGADVSARYPGLPQGWGAGLNDAQLAAAYQQHTRQSRRLYVGSIPPGTQNGHLLQFFNDAMVSSGAAVNPGAGPPVVQVTITEGKGFGFVEFVALEDAESALMFDGIMYNGAKLKVSRPNDYDASKNPLVVMRGGPEALGTGGGQLLLGGAGGVASGTGEEVKLEAPPPLPSEWPRLPKRTPDGPYKLYVGGFDPLHTEWQVRQLLQSVGELKSFATMPDDKGKNSGHAFCEFKDPRLTAVAEHVITGVKLFGKRLVCKRATPDAQPEVPGSGALATYRVPAVAIPLLEAPSRRLAVHNAIVAEHDAVAAAEVETAVAREAAAAAEWDPESVSSRRDHPDGRITLEFEEGGGGWSGVGGSALDAAVRCSCNLNGRTFEGRQLWVRYVPQAGDSGGDGLEGGPKAVVVV